MTSLSLSTIGQTGAATTQAPTDRTKLEKAAKAFEAVFVRQLLGSMRQGGFGDDLMSNSGVEQFQEMADARTADSLAERGSLGIAEMLLAQLGPKEKAATATTPTWTTEGKPE
ncbi:hypothetical protein BH10PSE13_BH10PSE13_12600 [soil metagenome]